MKDLRQIKVINKALENEKNKLLMDLSKINYLINKKNKLIKQLKDYLQDYIKDNNLKLSKSIPILYSNLNLFYKQIETTIHNTEIEIDKLKKSIEIITVKLQKNDQKIKLMDMFSDKQKKIEILEQSKNEQRQIDDIAITKNLRSEYE